MTVAFLFILVIRGLSVSWDFDPLFWWLLVPFFFQDWYDSHHNR